MEKNGSIGIFDSGLGGLTVMKQVVAVLPEENFVYFGDTARVPYGDKSPEIILKYSFENTTFLLSQHIKLLLVACNTASAYAVQGLRQQFSLPIVDVIEPAIEEAIRLTQNKRIAVLGTRGTIASGVYQEKIQEKLPGAKVFPMPCPLFVPLVEESFHDHPAARMIVREYLAPVQQHGVDTVIMGCTHYPVMEALIREALGEGVALLDSATACAKVVVERLKGDMPKGGLSRKGERRYYVSDSPERFRQAGEKFLGFSIEKVERHSL